jgi:hypothetical protein
MDDPGHREYEQNSDEDHRRGESGVLGRIWLIHGVLVFDWRIKIGFFAVCGVWVGGWKVEGGRLKI